MILLDLGAVVALPTLGLAGVITGRSVGTCGIRTYLVRIGAGWTVTARSEDIVPCENVVLLVQHREGIAL